MTKYVIDDTTLTSIADGVRKVTGTSAKMKPDEMATALKNVEVSDHYDTFWDAYLNNGNISTLTHTFSGEGWNEKTFFPKYNVFAGYNLQYAFRYNAFAGDFVQRMIDLGFGDVCFVSSSPTQVFRDMPNVTRLPFIRPSVTGNLISLNYCYQGSPLLETIDGVLAEFGGRPISFTSTFDGCTSLRNIRFEGSIANDLSFKDSSLLSDESVQDIIDHLKDLNGATAKTLTVHSDVMGRMTDEQTQEIWNKNWTLV